MGDTEIAPLIEIEFDLPFSLRVDGNFTLITRGEEFSLRLSTIENENPIVRGWEKLENVAIINDETTILSHTHVLASYRPSDKSEGEKFSSDSAIVKKYALSISNALITAARVGFEEFHIDYLHNTDSFGSIQYRVPVIGQKKAINGGILTMMGGFTFAQPPRTGRDTIVFSEVLKAGAQLRPAMELYFDARRYLLRQNMRMALVNLSISFELELADILAEVADHKGYPDISDKVARATISELGEKFSKMLLGKSLTDSKAWSPGTAEIFQWIRTARNGVLHKANMKLTFENRTRDFTQATELRILFSERDRLISELIMHSTTS